MRPIRTVLVISVMMAGAACGAGSGTAGEPTRRAGSPTGAGTSSANADVGAQLRRLETSYQGRIGAFALDTGTGKAIAYRAQEPFPGNSTFKAILCGAILSKARTTGPDLLDRTLRWTKDEVVPNSPITGRAKNIANGMTTAQLCHATITAGDNTAANVLLEQIGGPPGMTRFYRSLGDPVGRLDRREPELNVWKPGERRDTITPAYMARDLGTLTLGTMLPVQDRQRLIGWMRANTTGDERIRAGVPRNWTIGDKTGSGAYGSAGDIAIAWPRSGAPLVIAIYTYRNTADAEIDERVIAKTASLLARGLTKTS
jgi:beta-lactamase class A